MGYFADKEIKGLHYGGTRLSRLYYGESLIFAGLPSGYTAKEYITSNSNGYFDTGVVPNQDTHMQLKVRLTAAMFIAGARTAAASKAYCLYLNDDGSFINLQYGDSSSWDYYKVTAGNQFNVDYVYDLNKNVLSIDGKTAITAKYMTFAAPVSITLFGVHNNGGAVDDRRVKGRIYYCKIWQDDTLVRDFLPCANPSGVVGLYDMVDCKFYQPKDAAFV